MEWATEIKYFEWLCAKVMYVVHPTPSLTHWNLLRILHSTEFVWLLSGDDNRVQDGLELRDEFLYYTTFPRNGPRVIPAPSGTKASVFEVLLAFARRGEFQTDESAQDWFWEFLENLDLSGFDDSEEIDPADVAEILDRFIWRTYDRSGEGGILPLKNPRSDQRDVELWYQMAAYILENDRMS
jgi:hypothetical protein